MKQPLVSLLIAVLASPLIGQTTPTDVFYLVQGLQDSLASVHQLDTDFKGPVLSNSIKPRNVYQKAVSVMQELDTLYPNTLSRTQLTPAAELHTDNITPSEVYGVLDLGKKALTQKGLWRPKPTNRAAKTPSDVFQALRALSDLHRRIAAKQGLKVDWGTPARVYEVNLTQVTPILMALAQNNGSQPGTFSPPPQPADGVKPRHIYAFQSTLYHQLGKHFQTKGYQPIDLNNYRDMDRITPAEVLDLSLILLGELKVLTPTDGDTRTATENYQQFKANHASIGPGHVYHLLRYNFLTTIKALNGESG